MISKKVCLLGSFSVGKTSLVSRFVHSAFSDRYLSTIGVKISTKEIAFGDEGVKLVIWDIEGKDVYTDINTSYLRGASAFLTVADGTRKETLIEAMSVRQLALDFLKTPDVPNYLLVNKADLSQKWEISEESIKEVEAAGIKTFLTSAKTGNAVAIAFESISRDMLRNEGISDE
jgi:small GTP-binding protein